MGIDTQHKVLTLSLVTGDNCIILYCKQQNLGTQWSVNMASGSMRAHIQNKQYMTAKLNFTKSFF